MNPLARCFTDPVDQDQWQKNDQHIQPHVGVRFGVVIGDGFNVGRHEHDVHATRAELVDQEKHIHHVAVGEKEQKCVISCTEELLLDRTHTDDLHNDFGQRLQCVRTLQQGRLRNGRIVQTRHSFPLAQLVLRLDQQVDAVRTQEPDQQRADNTHRPPGMVEGVRHGENASAERTLQQMNQRFVVGRWMLDQPVLERIVLRL